VSSAEDVRTAMTEFLCSEAFAGRWTPFSRTNIRPLAEMTASVLAPWVAELIDGPGEAT
jgi:hypothetical protein